ncbi:MAG TPA: hypothetical protein VF386_00885 [Usitatibacter sp.]
MNERLTMWRYLPKARSRLLAFAAAAMAAFYAAIGIAFAANLMDRPVGLLIAPLFALLAWGIWTLSRFARWVTIIWIWLMVILMPLGLISSSGQGAQPYWGAMLAAITPLVVAGLFFLHVFGKHKREFKWP